MKRLFILFLLCSCSVTNNTTNTENLVEIEEPKLRRLENLEMILIKDKEDGVLFCFNEQNYKSMSNNVLKLQNYLRELKSFCKEK